MPKITNIQIIVKIITYAVLHPFHSDCYYMQKCCERNQQLARDFLTCISFDEVEGFEKYITNYSNSTAESVNFIKSGKNDTHHIWWLPPDVQFYPTPVEKLAGKNTIEFRYNTRWPCELSMRATVPFNDFVYLLDDGYLTITNIDDNIRSHTMTFAPNLYCIDRVSLITHKKSRGPIMDHSYVILLCPCNSNQCIRLCCPRKKHLSDTSGDCEYSPDIPVKWNLQYTDSHGQNITKPEYATLQNIPNCEHGYNYLNNNFSTKQFSMLPNGDVRIENQLSFVSFKDYCLDFTNLNGTYSENLRICNSVEYPLHKILYGIFLVIGSLSLLLTVIVYLLLRELRTNLFYTYLLFHLICLLVCYITLSVTHLIKISKQGICAIAGNVIQTSFIASILWLNVMCIDISTTFGNYRIKNKKVDIKSNKKVFQKYSFYTWGTTAIISILTVLFDKTNLLSPRFRPGFQIETGCWFSNEISIIMYFYLPVGIVLFINSLLFIYTLINIMKIQRDARSIVNSVHNESKIHTGNSIRKKERYRFILYTKLFAMMGIMWIFEIVSFVIKGPEYYWYLTDAVNSLRGLFIFIICCCKKKTFFLIMKSLNFSKSYGNGDQRTNMSITSSESTFTIGTSIQMEPVPTKCYESSEISE